MSAPSAAAADRYVWSRLFFAPSLQPMLHSPHNRHDLRWTPCKFPYGGSTSGKPIAGCCPGAAEKLTASGGNDHSSPSFSAASRIAWVLRDPAYAGDSNGYGETVGIRSARSECGSSSARVTGQVS